MVQVLETKPQDSNRTLYLDLCRIVACFFVIVNHTNSSIFLSIAPSPLWLVSLIYFYLSKIAVPVFIMISGALLLSRQDSYPKAFQRLIRIVGVVIIFSYLYYALSVNYDFNAMLDIRRYISAIVKGPITNAYWYLYLYVGILIMSPILQRMIVSFTNKDFLYFGFIAFIFLGTYPIILHFYPSYNYSALIALPIFNSSVALFIAGYYIDKYVVYHIKIFALSLIIFFVSTGVSVFMTYKEYLNAPASNGGGYLFFDNTQFITIISASLAFFYIAKYFCNKITIPRSWARIIVIVGKATFGIYLLSDFFINKLFGFHSKLLTVIHPFIAVVIWEIAVFFCGFVVTCILWRLPVFKKLI